MSISKVGGTYAYIYNPQTGRLSTKEGTEDDFTKYYNDGLTDELAERLNVFDAARKIVLKDVFIDNLESIGRIKKDGTVYEVAEEIVDGITSYYYLNGERILEASTGGEFTSEDTRREREIESQPHKTYQRRGYNPLDNSINISVGDVYDFKNGYRLRVKDNSVAVEKYGAGSRENDHKMEMLSYGLDCLIRFGDHGLDLGILDKQSMPMLIELLKQMGVDISRDFIVNKTKCAIENGQIGFAEYVSREPSESYKKMAKYFEEISYQPLSTWKDLYC